MLMHGATVGWSVGLFTESCDVFTTPFKTSNHLRNQKQGTDSSSLPPQNDIRQSVILSGAKNLRSI
ncbi:MAG: hypothetical protein PWQ06_1018, partial [Anaerophaga sp.]|nr:hypothetical protein [Anaerophaga sp.]